MGQQRVRARQVFVEGIKVPDGENIYVGDIGDVFLGQYNSGDYLIGPNPTSGFWADCPAQAMSDPQYACFFLDDFTTFSSLSGGAWVYKHNASGAAMLEEAHLSGVVGVGVLDLFGNSSGGYAFIQGCNVGGTGGVWKLTNGKKMWFQAEVNIRQATTLNSLVGLIAPVAAVDIMSSDQSMSVSAGVYFKAVAASGSLISSCARASNAETLIAAAFTTTSGGWKTLGFKWDGAGTLTPYLDDTAGTAIASGEAGLVTDVGLAPTFLACVGDQKDAERGMWVDWVKIVAER